MEFQKTTNSTKGNQIVFLYSMPVRYLWNVSVLFFVNELRFFFHVKLCNCLRHKTISKFTKFDSESFLQTTTNNSNFSLHFYSRNQSKIVKLLLAEKKLRLIFCWRPYCLLVVCFRWHFFGRSCNLISVRLWDYGSVLLWIRSMCEGNIRRDVVTFVWTYRCALSLYQTVNDEQWLPARLNSWEKEAHIFSSLKFAVIWACAWIKFNILRKKSKWSIFLHLFPI